MRSPVYDNLGRTILVLSPDAGQGRPTTHFRYDAADRLVEERWQASASAAVSHTIKRFYDRADQLLGVTETDTTNPAATTAWQFAYDALGQLIKSRMAPGEIVQTPALDAFPNPPGTLAAGDATIDWDLDGTLERYDGYSITLAVGDQLLLTASSTAFDPVLILQKPTGGLATAFFDDSSGGGTTARLLVTADTAGTWTVVVTSRDELATGSYDLKIVKDQNALVPTALVEYDFTYDKAGNLLTAFEDQTAVAQFGSLGPAASGLGVRTSSVADALNRFTRFRELDTTTNIVTKRTDYAYRPDGSVGTVTRFAGAGVNPVGTSTAAYAGDVRTLEIARPNDKIVIDSLHGPIGFLGQVVQRNFYGNGVDEILAVDRITWNGTTPTTSTFWTFSDHQDSVRDIVSGNAGSLGQVVEHRQYDSFGKVVRRTTGPQANAPATAGVLPTAVAPARSCRTHPWQSCSARQVPPAGAGVCLRLRHDIRPSRGSGVPMPSRRTFAAALRGLRSLHVRCASASMPALASIARREGTGTPSRWNVEEGLDCAATNPTCRRDRGCASANYRRFAINASSSLRLARPMR